MNVDPDGSGSGSATLLEIITIFFFFSDESSETLSPFARARKMIRMPKL
jgi:hypothetical protein